MYKKIFLILVLTFTLFYAKNVNASVTNVRFYDSNYTLISGVSGNCNTTSLDYPRNNVRYIRFNLDDQFQPNKSYSATFNFSVGALSDYAWLQWTGSSGFNLGGAYIGSTPDSARTSAQSVIVGPPNLYQKSSSTLFTFTTGTSVSNSFFQLDLISDRSIVNACMDSYSINIDNSSQDSQNIINNNNMNTGSIIANNNNNTNQIINNQNNNTQNIINNQNQNTQQQIESQQVCTYVDKNSVSDSNKFLNSTGVLTNSLEFSVTKYIPISDTSDLRVFSPFVSSMSSGTFLCFYNSNKVLKSCVSSGTFNVEDMQVSIPTGSAFFRASISNQLNRPSFKLCKNGNQALNDSLTDSNIDISGQIIDAPTTSHPISSLVTAPISFLQSLDDTCTPISFTLGFPGTTTKTITLPCGDTIFWNRTDLNYVQEFRLFWNVLFGGAILYFFGFKLFKTFEKALDPFETGINDLEV